MSSSPKEPPMTLRTARSLKDEVVAAIVTLVAMVAWGGLLHMLDR